MLIGIFCAWALDPNLPESSNQTDTPAGSPGAVLPEVVPPELAPWMDWVAASQPDRACVSVAEQITCVWPGALTLDATEQGASFSLAVRLDRPGSVALPGGRGAWPEGVRVVSGPDVGPVVVREVNGRPAAELGAGIMRLEGRYAWPTLPQGITLPDNIGLVRLGVGGVEVARPRVDSGVLRLGAGQGGEGEGRVDMDVSRRIMDGVPVSVETVIKVRVSGAGREVDLGDVRLPHTRTTSLKSPLPARLAENDHLVVQLRPGTWEISFTSLHDGPATTLLAPDPPAPWPDVEYWAFAADEVVRSVTLTGPASVDPARTPMPEGWRGMPSFRVNPGDVLTIDELRRGEPEPPLNTLTLSRELWLDFDGAGLTARDTFSGSLEQGWRLDLVGETAALGHASDAGQDQVITLGPNGTGVELRNQDVRLVAESRWEGATRELPAVGWSSDVTRLSATLHLPPGWSLIAAPGVDRAETVASAWNLLDGLLTVGLAATLGWLCGPAWGGALLLGLLGSVHLGGVPAVAWLGPVGAAVVARLFPHQVTRAVRWIGVIVAALVLFSVLQDVLVPGRQAPVLLQDQLSGDRETRNQKLDLKVGRGGYSKNLSAWVDPNAVAQTGPGVPTWTGLGTSLSWDGPVRADHQFRLILLPAGLGLIVRLSALMLLFAVLWRLGREPGSPASGPETGSGSAPAEPASGGPASAGSALSGPASVGVLMMLLLLPHSASAAPSPALLTELKARMEAGRCVEACVAVPVATLSVQGDQLVVTAEVHAAGPASWALPGPADAWIPRAVSLDGGLAAGMARHTDGFVHLRLDPGVHQVRLEGNLADLSALTLQFPLPPRRVVVEAEGWTVDGVRDDGSTEGALSVIRAASGGARDELAPWLSVVRFLDIGLPWKVRPELRRSGPGDRPVTVKIPLLPGEAVIDEGLAVRDGAVTVSLGRDTPSVAWTSTLEPNESLTLVAPQGVPWTEVWQIACSPVFSCQTQGPPTLSRIDEGVWSPSWRPWPGEQLVLTVTRPDAAPGQTLTIDGAQATYQYGPRLMEGTLSLVARSSQGGRLPVTLPEGSRVTRLTVDGSTRPVRAEGVRVDLPLKPGEQRLVLTFEQTFTPMMFVRAPELKLGGPAVNVQVKMNAPSGWSPLWVRGPGYGPAVTAWFEGLLLALVAWFVVRRHGGRWGLGEGLGPVLTALVVFGLGVVEPWMVMLVAAGMGLMGAAKALNPPFGVLLRVALAMGVGLVLLGVVLAGLLGNPRLNIAGGPDYGGLVWLVDRTEDGMPTPMLVLAPVWAWRVLALGWAAAVSAWGWRVGRGAVRQS